MQIINLELLTAVGFSLEFHLAKQDCKVRILGLQQGGSLEDIPKIVVAVR